MSNATTSRLTKLESIGLGMLRVAVLLLATLVFIVAVLLLIRGVPALQPTAIDVPPSAVGPAKSINLEQVPHTYAAFKAERNNPTSALAAEDRLNKAIDDAAVTDMLIFFHYYPRADILKLSEVTKKQLRGRVDAVGKGHAEDYLKSYSELQKSLPNVKTEKEFSADMYIRLIGWHFEQLDAAMKRLDTQAQQAEAEREAKLAAEQAKSAEAKSQLMMAGIALAAFMALALFFVALKIEQSLRNIASRESKSSPA